MTQHLLILRHAKSSWAEPTPADRDRPLNDRGRRAARTIGTFVAKSGHMPDLVLTSPALRARTTAQIAAATGRWPCPVELREALYSEGAEGALTVLATMRRSLGTIMIVGHEPTASEVVRHLTGAVVRMPTASLACLRIAADTWKGVADSRTDLRWLVTPKLIERLATS